MNKLLSEANKNPRTLFEARKVAGSATYKQIQTAWKASLFVQFIQSWEQWEFISFVATWKSTNQLSTMTFFSLLM